MTTIFAGLNCKCGKEHHYQGAAYYVSCRRDNGDHALLAGPYTEHSDSLAVLDRVKRLADDYDPRAHWYSYGTLAVLAGKRPDGVLNAKLAESVAAEERSPEELDRLVRRVTKKKARKRVTHYAHGPRASSAEQHGRYLDSGPQAWDDR